MTSDHGSRSTRRPSKLGLKARVVGEGAPRLDQIVVENQRLSNQIFAGLKLDRLYVDNSQLHRCRFESLHVDEASLAGYTRPSVFVECSFDNSRMRFGPAGIARFERCTFRNTDLLDWFCFAVELVQCVFSGRMRKCVFNGRPQSRETQHLRRRRNEFRGNDFTGADMIDVGFRTGIDLMLQQLPSASNYIVVENAAEALAAAWMDAAAMPAGEPQRLILNELSGLRYDVDQGQSQLFFRRDEPGYTGDLGTAHEAVFDILRRRSEQRA